MDNGGLQLSSNAINNQVLLCDLRLAHGRTISGVGTGFGLPRWLHMSSCASPLLGAPSWAKLLQIHKGYVIMSDNRCLWYLRLCLCVNSSVD